MLRAKRALRRFKSGTKKQVNVMGNKNYSFGAVLLIVSILVVGIVAGEALFSLIEEGL